MADCQRNLETTNQHLPSDTPPETGMTNQSI